ncbi:MAG: DUF1329 domain-containing protein [Caldimonas sp.]
MRASHTLALAAALLLAGLAPRAHAGVSAEEAATLKTTLTPLGGERAGNKEGTIPAWTGGNTTPTPGFVNGGRRPDPFAADKPLYSITAKNVDQYADKLSDGTKAMFRKFPDTYRIDVYPTRRTAAAPQHVYDETFKNATRGKLGANATGNPLPENVIGGIPFPIPKSGAEVIWNHNLRVRPEAWQFIEKGILTTSDGKHVTTVEGVGDQQMPYFFKEATPEKFDANYWFIRLVNTGPPIRAGEGITGFETMDPEKKAAWVYLPGQRRVRKLPNSCCDTPTPASAGVMNFDDIEVWTGGKLDLFDWKLAGKKEMIVPYNDNKFLQPTRDSDVLMPNHLNPDHVRWELHRVWVVDATLAAGKRHTSPKSRYYIDEDSWSGLLADRWDAKGQLWKTLWSLPVSMPDVPAVIGVTFGFYDLLSGAWYASQIVNEKSEHYRIMPRYPASAFTPDAMAGEGIR